MADFDFDRFYRYDELTALLQVCAAEHPDLCALESLGHSHEGRDIWLVTVTNTATGPAGEKPALWVDANIHATEIAGSSAALHLLHRLLSGFGQDERVTRVLDTRCFYIVPRINPDGVELALADRPRFLRSSTRPWPHADQRDGLVEEDIDGDGRVLTMRIEDPNGAWKPHPDEPRLLITRDPDEDGPGPYYRLLPEGMVQGVGGFDGHTIEVPRVLEGLDLNRNFPAGWRTEGEQVGAGPYPTSEPEARAVVQGLVDRPNVTGYIDYHTFSGVHLRPYSMHPDEDLPTFDLRVYTTIGAKATSITGYRAVSVFHDFKYEPKEVISGGSDDWVYDHLGVFAWTTELWSPLQQIGLKDYHFIEWYREHTPGDELALLAWSDDTLGGRGYVDWYRFEHPQLGPVELGGWDWFYCWSNPPPELLEREIAPHAEWAIWHLLISPLLRVRAAEAEPVGDATGTWQIRFVVENAGWLPTNVTAKAVERKIVEPVTITIDLPDGASLTSGKHRVECGQLTGRAGKTNMVSFDDGDATTDRAKADWVVHGPAGGTVRLTATHPRAGTARAEVTLG